LKRGKKLKETGNCGQIWNLPLRKWKMENGAGAIG
jgi:hypothetical protein